MKHIILSIALSGALGAQAQNITEYRWWINDDPGTITTLSAGPAADLALASTLDLPALDKDFNTITLQFKDSDGMYSVPYTSWYTKRTGPVAGYEWWIDDAIANSISGSIGPSAIADLIADLPTGVPAGTHLFTIRFQGTNGSWSVPLTAQFISTVGIEELPGITDLILFPNPVNHEIGLRLNTDAARTLKLQVLDLSGSLVMDMSTWGVSGNAYCTWDMSALSSGGYLLRLSDGAGTATLPFVKP